MRKTRFMSMLFLVWSIAFFFVPDFRQGLQGPIFTLGPEGDASWLEFAGTIPPKKLAEAARVAEQQRDARTLAFVALHAPTVQEGLRWAAARCPHAGLRRPACAHRARRIALGGPGRGH